MPIRLPFCLRYSSLIVASIWLWSESLSAAAPKLDVLIPTGVARGTTAKITVNSTDVWPVQVWSSRPELQIKALEEKGALEVNAPAEMPLGPVWIRLHNAEGSSPPRPFFVGTLPEVAEVEPNQEVGSPQVLAGTSLVVSGRYDKRNDVDTYALSLKAGQLLVADLVSRRRLGSPADPSLQLTDAKGFVLLQSDDDQGLDPRLVYQVPHDGTYLIRTFAFPAATDSSINFSGGATWVYRLTLTTGGFVDVAQPLTVQRGVTTEVTPVGWGLPNPLPRMPVAASADPELWLVPAPAFPPFLVRTTEFPMFVEPPSAAETPALPQLPIAVSGTISTALEKDIYRITARKDQPLDLTVRAREWGSWLDPVLEVHSTDAKVLQKQDDAGDSRDIVLTFKPPADGTFLVQVRDLHRQGSPRHYYQLEITQQTPRATISVAADQFTHNSDQPTEIPVTITRHHGFAEELMLTVEGLPEGVTSAPVPSPGTGDASKSVKLKLEGGAAPFSGPIRIVARRPDAATAPLIARFSVAEIETPLDQLWLTVIKK